jgi:hypothetical protein
MRVADVQRAASDRQLRATGEVHAPETVPPATQRAASAPVVRPDSFAPQVSLASKARERGSSQVIERAAWLMVGVVLALVLTLFPEVTYQLRSQLAGWIAPEPDTVGEVTAATAQQPSKAAASAETKRALLAEETDKSKSAGEETSSVALEDLFRDPSAKSKADDEANGADPDDRASRGKQARSGADGATGRAPTAGKARAVARASAAGKASARATKATAKSQTQPSGAGFDTAAARRALASAVQRAQLCASERANGTVTVTFAPSGGVQGVGLVALRGDEVRKGCVVRAFRGARVRPFDGSAVTVQKRFQLR